MIKPWRIRWAGYVARMGEKRNAYRILMDLTEIGWGGMDWIDLPQYRDQ
jgi:hypothetical protein